VARRAGGAADDALCKQRSDFSRIVARPAPPAPGFLYAASRFEARRRAIASRGKQRVASSAARSSEARHLGAFGAG
jgi:hypothetical protein